MSSGGPAQLAESALSPTVEIAPAAESEPAQAEPAEKTSAFANDTEPFASPVPLRRTKPQYRLVAVTTRQSGTVGLLVKISADGTVSDVKVTKSAGSPLDKAAVSAAFGWTYKPARKNDRPVNTWVEETVEFKLK